MEPRKKCYICGKPIQECTCDDEDFEDDGETSEEEESYDEQQFKLQFKNN